MLLSAIEEPDTESTPATSGSPVISGPRTPENERLHEPEVELARVGRRAGEPPSGSALEPAAEAPLSETTVSPDRISLHALAAKWAAAWSAQEVDDYLAFYSRGFAPENGLSREEWETQRRDRLMRPSFIIVELSELRADLDDSAAPSVTFTQLYRSNTFTDTVRKTLVLIREDGGWKIARELADAGR